MVIHDKKRMEIIIVGTGITKLQIVENEVKDLVMALQSFYPYKFEGLSYLTIL